MRTICNAAGRLLALTGAAALLGCAARGGEEVWTQRTTLSMGTTLTGVVAAPTEAAGFGALEGVFAEIARLDGVLSSWREESEIGRLNASAPGEAVPVTPELGALLEEARGWGDRTGGAFDPAVGALVDAWGLRGAGRRPTAAELAEALAATGMRHFRADGEGRAVARLHPAAWLDTGGFGKGAALRGAREALAGAGVSDALLDFGGQLLALGSGPGEGDGTGWEVRVAHPSRRDEPALGLRVRDASVSTTSQSERFVVAAGERLGHVLDPRTGEPVPAWGSVTVVAEDPMVADVLSTALFVMGPEAGMEWARARDDVGVLFLEERGGELVERWNAAFERHGPINRSEIQ